MEKLEILTAALPQQIVGRKDRIRKAARRFLQLVAIGLISGPYGNRFRRDFLVWVATTCKFTSAACHPALDLDHSR
jgi:hypothetical protein